MPSDSSDPSSNEGQNDELDVTAEQAEPLDLEQESRRLVTQPYDLSVQTLVDNVESKQLLLSEVPYQRGYVWDDSKASRLVESLLLNVPIPVCYFAENPDGSLEVIDGQQRIRSICRFVNNEFALRGIPVLREIDGSRFSELSDRDQRRISNRTIRCIVITEDSHPDIKFDVFERLNTGSVSLSAQELRNCIYRGPFNNQLKDVADDPTFLQALGRPAGSNRDTRMEEEELVLRFLALLDQLTSYKPAMRQFLNRYIRDHRQQTINPELLDAFNRTCDIVASVFDGGAFYGQTKEGEPTKNINKAIYDAIMISFAKSNHEEVLRRADEVRRLRDELLDSEQFQTMIGRATADRTRVQGRIKAVSDGLRRLGIQVQD